MLIIEDEEYCVLCYDYLLMVMKLKGKYYFVVKWGFLYELYD